MPLPGRTFARDEELGKKNDDHRPGNGTIPVPSWSWVTSKPSPRMRRRRVFYGLVAVLLLYLFIKNIPTDLGPVSQRVDTRVPGQSVAGLPLSYSDAPVGQPPHPAGKSKCENHYYDGQIKHPYLAASLYGIARTMGYREHNKNVLFSAANLQSASKLIPMACEMARWNRNNVHFAIMGRDDLSLQDIQTINGVGAECEVYWHDARPDRSPWSSDFRMQVSVGLALGHIRTFMHPQVHIIDGSSKEEAIFTKGVRQHGYNTGKPVIELPPDAAKTLMWITRLDTGSLSAWHKTYVDIVIHAPRESSGSLIRLIKSIEAADYYGSRRPHLTIELPPNINSPTLNFLENLIWPPLDPSGAPHSSQVSIRHRIPRGNVGTEEASAHFLESFYPARPKDSHVLLLSPQAELSPLYYHYLMYNLLEYKYSSYGSASQEAESLMGISLELPSHHLNETEPLSPPPNKPKSDLEEDNEPKKSIGSTETLPFLWQAPNSNAALYFGDKWTELHTFFAARISAGQVTRSSLPTRPKIVSSKYPAWMEYVLEFMRIKAYTLIYPNFESLDSIATVHNELYQLPEEFVSLVSSADITSPPTPSAQDPKEPFTVDPKTISMPPSQSREIPLLKTSLLTILPNAGDLPELSSLTLLSYSGNMLTTFASYKQADYFAKTFSREIGGCKASKKTESWKRFSVDELFCYDDDDDDDESADKFRSLSGEGNTKEGPGEESIPRKVEENPGIVDEFRAHMARQAKNSR